jgi:hypothetical protein
VNLALQWGCKNSADWHGNSMGYEVSGPDA